MAFSFSNFVSGIGSALWDIPRAAVNLVKKRPVMSIAALSAAIWSPALVMAYAQVATAGGSALHIVGQITGSSDLKKAGSTVALAGVDGMVGSAAAGAIRGAYMGSGGFMERLGAGWEGGKETFVQGAELWNSWLPEDSRFSGLENSRVERNEFIDQVNNNSFLQEKGFSVTEGASGLERVMLIEDGKMISVPQRMLTESQLAEIKGIPTGVPLPENFVASENLTLLPGPDETVADAAARDATTVTGAPRSVSDIAIKGSADVAEDLYTQKEWMAIPRKERTAIVPDGSYRAYLSAANPSYLDKLLKYQPLMELAGKGIGYPLVAITQAEQQEREYELALDKERRAQEAFELDQERRRQALGAPYSGPLPTYGSIYSPTGTRLRQRASTQAEAMKEALAGGPQRPRFMPPSTPKSRKTERV